LNAETQRFMSICFCCPVVQGYGLTETCGGATLADNTDLSTGTVGPPLRCCEILLRPWEDPGYFPTNEHPQGEILIHGDNVALGYYKDDEKTKEAFIFVDKKRWFATGDIGEFRKDGSLYIIDRKKDLVKLSDGEYVSLGKIETALVTHPLVDNICAYGNSHFNYVVALVVPNEKQLKAIANENGIPPETLTWMDLCKNARLRGVVEKMLEEYATKNGLGHTEIPKHVFLSNFAWTAQDRLLTEALKLKRKKIEERFAVEIKAMYPSNSSRTHGYK